MANYIPYSFIGPYVVHPAIAEVNTGISYGLGGDALTGTDSESGGGSSVTPTSVRIIEVAITAEAIGEGAFMYVDRDDNLAYLVDTSSATKPAAGDTLAIALTSSSAGQPVAYAARNGDKITYSVDRFEQGLPYVGGPVKGELIPAGDLANPNQSVIAGYAETNAIFVFQGKRTGVAVNITP